MADEQRGEGISSLRRLNVLIPRVGKRTSRKSKTTGRNQIQATSLNGDTLGSFLTEVVQSHSVTTSQLNKGAPPLSRAARALAVRARLSLSARTPGAGRATAGIVFSDHRANVRATPVSRLHPFKNAAGRDTPAPRFTDNPATRGGSRRTFKRMRARRRFLRRGGSACV